MRIAMFGLAILAMTLPFPLAAGSRTAAADDPDDPLAGLAWLAGCWESRDERRIMQEHWLPPLGGTMIGVSRTVAGSRTVAHEFLQIRLKEGQVVYVARPSDQAETAFAAIEITPTGAVFENLGHDFPQRIIYRLAPDGSLLARIEGERGGELRGVDFPLRRAVCPGQPEPWTE
jgi:hypothetical protein